VAVAAVDSATFSAVRSADAEVEEAVAVSVEAASATSWVEHSAAHPRDVVAVGAVVVADS